VELLPALVLTAAFLGAAALQVRFAQGLIGAAAALVGMQVALLWEQRRASRRLGFGVALAMLPMLGSLRPLPYEPPTPEIAKVHPSLLWLRTQARGEPPGGVRADHQLGHFINLWAEKPAVASLFSQLPEHVDANHQAVAALHALTEDEAVERARALKVRWLLVTPLTEVLGGRPSRDDVAAWLHEDAGLETATREASARFRLVHESEARRSNAPDKPTVRIFELVKGAALFGRAPPGATVEARVSVFGRPYIRRTRADAVGEFVLLVAHPSAEGYALRLIAKGQERGVDACRDSADAGSTSVQVREQDVQRGLMVSVGTLAPCPTALVRESP